MFDSIARLEKTLTRVAPLRGQRQALWLGAGIAVLACIVAYGVEQVEVAASRHVFEERVHTLHLSLEAHLAAPLEALRTLPPYFEASSSVERQELADYVASALHRHPSISFFAWAPEVASAELADFQQRARQVGWPGYRIWQHDAHGTAEPVPAGPARHLPLLHVEPPRPEITGLDLFSVPSQRGAVLRALRNDEVVGAPALEEDEAGRASMTLYAPVAKLRARDPDPRAPRLGVALMTLRLSPLFAASLTAEDANDVDLWLVDDTGRPLFASRPQLALRPPPPSPSDVETPLDFAGFHWTVRYVPRSGVVAAGSAPWLVAGLGLLVALVAMLAVAALEVAHRMQREMALSHRLGPYTLVRKLGEGGMGAVYEAEHALLRRPTAIKVISPSVRNAALTERFEREVKLTSQLSHPHTIAIYDFGRTREGVFYYSMEFLQGSTVADLVRREGPLPPARAVHMLEQVCAALSEAHALGLVHRDIKPSNLMVCERGGIADFIKVLDFGLVKTLQPEATGLTQDGSMLGTPRYMAPELFEDPPRPSVASDLYAIGAVAYYMLCGSEVFAELPLPALMAQVATADPPRPSAILGRSLPRSLESLVMHCLRRAPEARPASAAELRALLRGSDVPVWTEQQATDAWRRSVALAQAESEASPLVLATADTLSLESGQRHLHVVRDDAPPPVASGAS